MKKIITLLVLSFLLPILLACQTTPTTTEINFDLFQQIDRYQDIFTRREGTYLVYVYSDTCGACLQIKEEMATFGNTYTRKVIYFFNASKATDAQTYQQLYLTYIGQTQVQTPVILVVVDNTFDSTNQSLYYYAGVQAIRNITRDLQNNAYLPFQE